ncbi:MAG: helix-turn-helix transcriptional regulator [Lachnospiraceae bacterium]|nr:helix-turn-helix transcriptional regulator [Lachnospiraceae bacterium]
MIRAYDELYLTDARRTLANCFDYAAGSLKIPLEDFYIMFAQSDIAIRFEKGDPFVFSGHSGVELALMVISKRTGKYEYKDRIYKDGRSKEYWAGWAIAFYQWYSSCSFMRLCEDVPVREILNMYEKYHEMDIMHFVDRINEIRQGIRLNSYLKKLRQMQGYSQSELAALTGIPVRTLQHYEQGTKSIEKASASYVLALSRALECSPDELIRI